MEFEVRLFLHDGKQSAHFFQSNPENAYSKQLQLIQSAKRGAYNEVSDLLKWKTFVNCKDTFGYLIHPIHLCPYM